MFLFLLLFFSLHSDRCIQFYQSICVDVSVCTWLFNVSLLLVYFVDFFFILVNDSLLDLFPWMMMMMMTVLCFFSSLVWHNAAYNHCICVCVFDVYFNIQMNIQLCCAIWHEQAIHFCFVFISLLFGLLHWSTAYSAHLTFYHYFEVYVCARASARYLSEWNNELCLLQPKVVQKEKFMLLSIRSIESITNSNLKKIMTAYTHINQHHRDLQFGLNKRPFIALVNSILFKEYFANSKP